MNILQVFTALKHYLTFTSVQTTTLTQLLLPVHCTVRHPCQSLCHPCLFGTVGIYFVITDRMQALLSQSSLTVQLLQLFNNVFPVSERQMQERHIAFFSNMARTELNTLCPIESQQSYEKDNYLVTAFFVVLLQDKLLSNLFQHT